MKNKNMWRVSLAECRNDEDERILVSADSPYEAAEVYAGLYWDEMGGDPFEKEKLFVAVWVDGKPKCYQVIPYVAYESYNCEFPDLEEKS